MLNRESGELEEGRVGKDLFKNVGEGALEGACRLLGEEVAIEGGRALSYYLHLYCKSTMVACLLVVL